MPYVTQSRSIIGDEHPFRWIRGEQVYPAYPGNEFRAHPTVQQTYSYRTGRLVEQLEASGVGHKEKSGEEMRDELRRTGDVYLPQITPNPQSWGGPHDKGHEFWTTTKRDLSLYPVHRVHSSDGWVYEGPLSAVPSRQGIFWPEPRTMSEGQLRSVGNRLHRSALPTRPDANLAILVAETAQRIPSLPGLVILRERNRQAIGKEYLNYEFGIRPMIADILKAAKAVLDFNTNLERFKEHADKPLHRRRKVPTTRETEVVFSSEDTFLRPSAGRFHTGQDWNWKLWPSGVGVTAVDEFVTDTWFSGSFTYYIHDSSNFLGRMAYYGQAAEKLLGTGLSVPVFWELTPWSWLIDWFLDVGSFLRIAESNANDGLVMRYGYLMTTTSVTRHIVTTRATDSLGNIIPPLTHEFLSYRKERRRGNPYGFGLGWEFEMTPKRWAILAALGLTKSDTKLRTAE